MSQESEVRDQKSEVGTQSVWICGPEVQRPRAERWGALALEAVARGDSEEAYHYATLASFHAGVYLRFLEMGESEKTEIGSQRSENEAQIAAWQFASTHGTRNPATGQNCCKMPHLRFEVE